ncbi:saccharopine dehydrogenase [Arthrobacter alpinus]|uniref:saccharopine dehydrogenase family protein n=1 Tax=Arthrobacter alpinus TaxID=656366 RepID=UPI0005C8AB94|nr:saccharopine dehydrogenase [Arthrobacter alpinus]ALV45163.1 saccharopine dehydrogenase [Arthrobacter alpinus]
MTDLLNYSPTGPILIVGGYGTVGSALARLCAPSWPLLLTGRNPANGADLAAELGATLRRWDVNDPAPFSASARAVISTVNDPHDRVLGAAVRAGIPYVDVTRWTSRMTRAATAATLLRPSAPVLLSSGWMGGIVNIVAASLISELDGAQSIDIAIRYDVDDRAGADSVDFIDRLGQDYEVRRNGALAMVSPLSDARWVEIGGYRTKVARLDTPEQLTLPLTLGVESVTTRIGFSSNASTTALLAARKLGFFRWGRGERWTGLRRSLLYSPGQGGSAIIRIDAHGIEETRSVTITDPLGQAHLTALGGYLGLQQVLGARATAGVLFPESRDDLADALAQLQVHNVLVLAA